MAKGDGKRRRGQGIIRQGKDTRTASSSASDWASKATSSPAGGVGGKAESSHDEEATNPGVDAGRGPKEGSPSWRTTARESFAVYKAGQQYSVGNLQDLPLPAPTDSKEPIQVPTPPDSVLFVNWGIYGRKFPPSLIPVNDLTHVLYAFANVRADTGEVILSDVWADKDIHYPGDSWNDVGNNLYGNFKAIYKLKQQNRHLKVLLSIGGWTYSPSFHPVVVNPQARYTFVQSAVKLLEDYGLDGLDIDYEYPSNHEQAAGYRELLRELRFALDQHSRNKRIQHKFLLTPSSDNLQIAAPCGPDNYQKLDIRGMDPYLDFWNLMAYDFSGSWDRVANHQANVYGPPINADDAIQWYNSNGVPRSKLVLGIPLYGRSFMNTDSRPGAPFSGLGPGSWEQGVYDYRALPLPGSYMFQDDEKIASWSYDYQKREMISFDNEHVGTVKGQWIHKLGLGGSMFWELSGDKGRHREGMEGGPGKDPVPGRSLVNIVKEAMGPLDQSTNWLWYEGSQFDNLRNGII
ncbi:glycoside hydrolase family 18 protein [Paxillus rubicundulus Ve08.2h10]|uniref:chitinase n=1 Tax=Paxillus rubicundulus Ve08.2h10 TaxID=930991 RepID=A0A0D0ECA9_9AGAM|nr:glycoside hydrolase family 18 protein [Paxillus rubicundulus Ve08.2h10]